MTTPAISDEALIKVLGGYAGLVHRVLTDPERWLGVDEPTAAERSVPVKALGVLRRGVFGRVRPGSSRWEKLSVKRRVNWWLRRISFSAGLAAAVPRVAGALADRLPLQDALGASASGLAVCATARELGVTDAPAWVPLLAKVLFGRDVDPQRIQLPSGEEADRTLTSGATPDGVDVVTPRRRRLVGRAGDTIWRLARGFREVSSMLDERPHGGLLSRVLGKLPVVGVAGGWLDERGGIRRASKQTITLLD